MGKYVRKCKAIGEIAVMEVAQVGVRITRARAALAMAAAATSSSGTAKRRKASSGKLEFSASFAQLRRRRRVLVTPENSASPATSGNSRRQTTSNVRSASPTSDHILTSCCSSNGSGELTNERVKFVDLEEESAEIEMSTYESDSRGRERREATPASELQVESGELESTATPSEANSLRRLTVEKMPSESELEEFFAAAEKDIQKRFTEKYNYDIVKDAPLEGRYEWVQLKQ
ncbi:unnamed protein product [Ilex paraguariensis]|uniref:Cyclin-dependent kinase inhibitor domain-containing protein n=1 Tax=Ilex paraguariensis TaxID=185542 RepID=A0ABC8TED2_9AQUA